MRLLGVFAKYWAPGEVKTRLAAAVGNVAAAEFYAASLRVTLGRLGALAERRWLVYWPPERQAEFAAAAGDRWALEPQADGDLGRRMEAFFRRAFDQQATRVVLLGSDSPTVPLEYIDQAFDRLRHAPVVLGPSADGGYYLVGAAGRVPPIFDRIAWSTPSVWNETLARLAHAGLQAAHLPAWYDVDELADLGRLHGELRELPDDAIARRELLPLVERMAGRL